MTNPDATVLTRTAERITHITLNRPDALNAIDITMDGELRGVLAEFDSNPHQWVAIVSGAGSCFSAGHDLRQAERSPGRPTSRPSFYFLDAPVNWKPVIAAVHGYCYGLGLVFASECDIVVATEDSTFCVIETKRGMPAITLMSQLAHVVGMKKAVEMTLTSKPISAAEAHRTGLVNKLVASYDELLPAAEELARDILESPPLPVRTAVQVSRGGVMQSQLHREATIVLQSSRFTETEDFAEGVQAFREKRRPVYVGR